ncbi:MAG: phage protease [Kiritimatiellae bacterium]|nr:phage protease [Kiritimatiellia bacterium]
MSAVLLNREGFAMPADGWYQVAPLGEFGHAQAGVVQVVDLAACEAMAKRFADEAKAADFAGLLIDFDHFSLDGEKRSEAAGWITALEARGEGSGDGVQGSGGDGENAQRATPHAQLSMAGGAGLWAKIRWSDVGEAAVKGGRYRFLSPVWRREDCEELGNERLRPMRLLNAAVTNDPNLKGIRPLSNRGESLTVGTKGTDGTSMANAGERRYRWVLGDNKEHCSVCARKAGKVHTKAEWAEIGGACLGACHCHLEEVANENRSEGGKIANVGWTDAARAAALRIRQLKAQLRADAKKKEVQQQDDAGQRRTAPWSKPPKKWSDDYVDPRERVWTGGTPDFDESTGKYRSGRGPSDRLRKLGLVYAPKPPVGPDGRLPPAKGFVRPAPLAAGAGSERRRRR